MRLCYNWLVVGYKRLVGSKKPHYLLSTIYCLFYILHSTFYISCTSPTDNAWNGTAKIVADESLKPMVSQLCQAYELTTPNAHFKIDYTSETEAIQQVLKDSVRLAFIARELVGSEKQALKDIKLSPRLVEIATDGVALITSRENNDSLITIQQLLGIFSGKIKDWSGLKGSKKSGKLVLVFDKANASNVNYMAQKFGIHDFSTLTISAAGSNEKVIEYVHKTPNAIGFIGVNWLSDGDEALTAQLAKKIRVMYVAKDDTSRHFQPTQEALAIKQYPLSRKIYILNRETYPGLATALTNYIFRDVGSIVIEKCGLWPKQPYKREIIIKKEM